MFIAIYAKLASRLSGINSQRAENSQASASEPAPTAAQPPNQDLTRSEIVKRAALKKRGNRPRKEASEYERVHLILAKGEGQ